MNLGELSVKYLEKGKQFALYDGKLLYDWWYVDDLSVETIETLLEVFNNWTSGGADRLIVAESIGIWLGYTDIPF